MRNEDRVEVLIVDDRPENLLAVESVIENPGLNIIKASTGNEALSLMLDHEFALAILDVQMPGIDGFETAELMRGSEKTRQIPIIFVTALSKEHKYVFKGYESGAVDYLFKPIDPGILRSKVKVFCELFRQKRIIQDQLREIEEKNEDLKKYVKEIKALRGFLPICAECKKIRDDKGYWTQVEKYISDHSEAEFSHSICPDCAKKLYPQYYKEEKPD